MVQLYESEQQQQQRQSDVLGNALCLSHDPHDGTQQTSTLRNTFILECKCKCPSRIQHLVSSFQDFSKSCADFIIMIIIGWQAGLIKSLNRAAFLFYLALCFLCPSLCSLLRYLVS